MWFIKSVILLPTLLILHFASPACAQTSPEVLWQTTIPVGIPLPQGPFTHLEDDSYYLVEIKSFGSASIYSQGYTVSRLDTLGNLLWIFDRAPTGLQKNQFVKSATLVDPAGNTFVGQQEIGLPGVASDDVFLEKIDPNGELVWSRTYRSHVPCFVTLRQALYTEDVIYLTANRYGFDDADDYHLLYGIDPEDGAVLWLDSLAGDYANQAAVFTPEGIQIFATKLNSTGSAIPTTLVYNLSGDLIIESPATQTVGEISTYLYNTGFGVGSRFSYAAYFVDMDGEVNWSYSNPDQTIPGKILDTNFDIEGNMYTVGGVGSPALRLLVSKFLPTGELDWQAQGSQESGRLGSLGNTILHNEELLIIGGRSFFDVELPIDTIGATMWLFNPIDGEEIFKLVLNSAPRTFATIQNIDLSARRIYYAGRGIDEVNQAITVIGSVRLPELTSIPRKGNDVLFQAFPNPATEAIRLTELDTRAFDRLTVTDATGRTVYTAPLTGSSLDIDVGTWAAGTYTLHLRGKAMQGHKRFVVVQ